MRVKSVMRDQTIKSEELDPIMALGREGVVTDILAAAGLWIEILEENHQQKEGELYPSKGKDYKQLSTDKIPVTLNGIKLSARPGITILDLAQENGVDIPTLCYRPELPPIAVCRLCVVEVEGSRTLVASCHTPVAPNMVIHTDSPKVIKTRKMIVELLLGSHPDICLVCDKANLCELRKIAADLGVGLPRFRTKKRYYPLEDVSSYIVRDMSKCILCRRCLRACHEIKKADVYAIAYRGFDSKVVVDQDQPLDKSVCQSCDVCLSLCPVGALIKHEERFKEKKSSPHIIKG